MAEWEIKLMGDQFDLEELPKFFVSKECTVTKGDELYYLTSNKLNPDESSQKIHGIALDLVQRINGILKVIYTNFRPVEIHSMDLIDDKGRRNINLAVGNAEVRTRASAVALIHTVPGSPSDSSSEPTPFTVSWLKVAEKDEKVRDVLNIFGSLDEEWRNLYNILEIVLSDVGGKIFQAGWASEKEVGLFKQTANSRDAIGYSARHGDKEKCRPPKNPMSLSDAKSLIRKIVGKWISSKIPKEKE